MPFPAIALVNRPDAMKLVFEHIDFTTAGHIQSLLEAEGIPTRLKNLNNSSLAGEIPFAQVFPEVWVLDDSDETRALSLIRDHRDTSSKSAKDAPAEWICPNCRERVEGVFGECWNCQTPHPASA